MMHFNSKKRPPARNPNKWFSPRQEDILIKAAAAAFILLTCPIWIPIWIVMMPYYYLTGRLSRKAPPAREALRASMPPRLSPAPDPLPPPEPPEPELLRRRELAKQTRKIIPGKSRHLQDPIRADPAIAKLIDEAGDRARMEVTDNGRNHYFGCCHRIWSRQKEILKQDHGITWFSQSEMNPNVIYD